MFNYVLKRIGFSILALFILITLIFFLAQLMPTWPITKGIHESMEDFYARLQGYGLLDPPIEQYARFWQKLFETGTFGTYFSMQSTPISDVYAQVLPYTIIIAGISFVVGVIVGVILGITAAIYRGKWQDTVINVVSVLFISIPSFVLASFFSRWASESGWKLSFPAVDSALFSIPLALQTSLLPIATLAISIAPPLVYYTRNEMVEVLSQDYIKTALAKGVSYNVVIFRHGLRNCLVPIVSICTPTFLVVIGGSIIIENFFQVPGIAKKLVEAVQKKEIYLLMYNALVISGIYFLLEILADISFTLIDSRIRLASSNSISWFAVIRNYIYRNNQISKFNKLISQNIFEVEYNSKLHNEILNNDLANYRKKTIYLDSKLIDAYSLNENHKYLIYMGDKFKVKYLKDNKEMKGVN